MGGALFSKVTVQFIGIGSEVLSQVASINPRGFMKSGLCVVSGEKYKIQVHLGHNYKGLLA